MLEKVKKDFPILATQVHGKPLCYLDSAATAQKPQAVIDAMAHFDAAEYGTVHRSIYETAKKATARYEKGRRRVAQFLGAPREEEVIFTRGTTEAINLLAICLERLGLIPEDEIIVTELEHHSNFVPWQMLCKQTGATLKVIPSDDEGNLDLKKAGELITARTKLVAVAHISNALGTVHPVKEIVALAKAKGSWVLVDGAQSAPCLPIDVQDLGCDFYCFSSHKLFGPTGLGVLWGRYELLETLPPYHGGGHMIENVSLEGSTFQKPPLRFEAGTPMISQVVGLSAAIDYMEHLGREQIAAHDRALTQYLLEQLEALDFVKIVGRPKERLCIVSFVLEGIHPLDAATFLDFEGVAVRSGHHCAEPALAHFGYSSTLRASVALYNQKEDIDQLVAALQTVHSKLASPC